MRTRSSEDFDETLGTDLPRDRGPTMAGLILGAPARRPEAGDTVTLDGVELAVERLDGLRITRVRAAPVARR